MHLCIYGHSRCFQSFAFTNIVAVNILVHALIHMSNHFFMVYADVSVKIKLGCTSLLQYSK